MTAQSLAYTLDQVIARIQELATNGVAPGFRTYNAQRGPGLPAHATLAEHGYNWMQLIELAGLEPAKRGGPPGSRPNRINFEAADAEVRHRLATAEPPRPATWPLFGIPTKTEIRFGQLPDGTPVRVTRQYYSLR